MSACHATRTRERYRSSNHKSSSSPLASLWFTNRPADTEAGSARTPNSTPPTGCTPGSREGFRTGKDAGLGHFPYDFAVNAVWLTAAMTGQILRSWLKLLALDGDLSKAEPKTLRYRGYHARDCHGWSHV